jgi:hypothetical protein
VFETKAPNHDSWQKVGSSGVLCLLKDYNKRSYFLCLFSFSHKKMVWQNELYRQIAVFREAPFLLTFEGKVKKNLLNAQKHRDYVEFVSEFNGAFKFCF